jgi:hypothetical protein
MWTIKNSMTGSELQIASKDFTAVMRWEAAKKSCENLGNGWRLPTFEELKDMYEQLHQKGEGNFDTTCGYWSTDVTNNGNIIAMDFDGSVYFGVEERDSYLVRAVRYL